MSRAYSAMVRSEENLPQLAVLSTAIFIHRSWSCRITGVTSHPQMGSGAILKRLKYY
jgi:ABC-type Co2+ transport system permease subunit